MAEFTLDTTLDLTLPVVYHFEVIDGKEYHVIATNDETKKFLDIPVVVQKETKEEAIKTFWIIVNMHLDHLKERSRQADKWELFRKGPKSPFGSTWFTILGINFHFRQHRKDSKFKMKGGWNIPLTKWNISIHNHWKRKYDTKRTDTSDKK